MTMRAVDFHTRFRLWRDTDPLAIRWYAKWTRANRNRLRCRRRQNYWAKCHRRYEILLMETYNARPLTAYP